MSKEEEYREHALTLLDLAQRQSPAGDKSRIMALAEAWLDLAERAARSPMQRIRRLASQDALDPQGAD